MYYNYSTWTANGGGGGRGGAGADYYSSPFEYFVNQNLQDCIIEEYIGTALVSRRKIMFDALQAKQFFFTSVKSMAGLSPRGIKLIWYDYIYDQIEGTQKSIENSAEAWNFHRDDWDLA